jgi:serine/threonine protein kinase
MIKRLLTVNPRKRILIDEIKAHPFFQQGEMQINNEKKVYDKQKLFDKIISKMESIGMNREAIIKNIENNRHNNITTTYSLLSKKYKATILIKKSKSEDIDKAIKSSINEITSIRKNQDVMATNPNININIKYLKNFGNININITDPKGAHEKSIRLREASTKKSQKG